MQNPQHRRALRSARAFRVLAPLWMALLAWMATACRQQGGDAATSVRAPVPPPYRLEGKVLKPDSNDHSGILVYCAGTSFLAYSDEQGHYAITGVPQGQYKVLCQHPDYQGATIKEISLAEGFADPATPVVLPDATLQEKLTPTQQAERVLCSIMGQVLLSNQETAEGIVVSAVNTGFRTVTGPDGSYQLLRLDPGQYTLLFEKPGYQSQKHSMRLEKGGLEFMNQVVLEPLRPPEQARALSGTVALLTAQGQAITSYTGVLVYLEGTTLVTLPGAQGFFRFENLRPNRYVVTAMAPGFFSRDRAEADLTEAAEVTVSLTLQSTEERTSAPGVLSGRVLRDDPKDLLVGTLVGLVELGATVMTDANGGYVFSNIPPRSYTVVAQAEGYNPAALEQVAVAEGAQVQAADLTLEKRRDYPRVVSTDPANGARNVLIREVVPLTIRFSKKMRPETLRAAFSIQPPVAFTLYTGRDHAQSDFDLLYVEMLGLGGPTSLHFNTAYTVTISAAAQDFEDLNLQAPHRFRFTTGRASIIGTQPPDGAADVYLDPALHRAVVMFNAPIDPKTVTADRVRVRPALGTNVLFNVVNMPNSGWSHITLSATWSPGIRYSVTLIGGIRTVDGSPVSNLPYTFSFTTSAGRELDLTPGQVRGRR